MVRGKKTPAVRVACRGDVMKRVEELGFDLTLTGFTPEDIQIDEVAAPEETAEDEASPKLRKRYTCPQCGCEFDAK